MALPAGLLRDWFCGGNSLLTVVVRLVGVAISSKAYVMAGQSACYTAVATGGLWWLTTHEPPTELTVTTVTQSELTEATVVYNGL